MAREGFILVCNDCKNENYIDDKNKKKQPNRVEYKKFCPKCNKQTLHKEKK